MNQFKFHSVGQGLFYTGSLANGNYNFVYDCGTESEQWYLDNCIKDYTREIRGFNNEKAIIDFVVISHLHKDHFSGLYRLSKQANIKKVYLPYLGKEHSIIKVILLNEIILKPQEDFEDTREIYSFACRLYLEKSFGETKVEFLGEYVEHFEEEGFCYSHKESSFPERETPYWKFIFINKTISQSIQQKLLANLNKYIIGFEEKSIEEIIANDGFNNIAKAYRETFKNNQNITSTLLYHYPVHLRTLGLKGSNRNCCLCNSLCTGCYYRGRTLLTGDAEFTQQFIKELEDLFEKGIIYKYVDVLQIPHHGAKKNWKSLQKTQIRSKCYIISFGLGNQYYHPNPEVISDFSKEDKKLYLVNQINDFDYYIY